MATTLSSNPVRLPRDESKLKSTVRRFRKTRLALLGGTLCTLVVVVAVFAPVLVPYEPNQTDIMNALQPPSLEHWLGTDELGRDVLSRVFFGSRVSLLVGLVSVGAALVLGVTLGMLAGYLGGWLDNVIMRVMDSILAFPGLILALAIAAVLGTGLTAPMIAIAVVNVPGFARLTRGQVLSVRENEFILAARTVGSGAGRIMLRHVLPNITAPLIIQTSLSIAFAILAEASLSFLGLGIPPPDPSWGRMVSEGRQFLRDASWMAFGPGFSILITVMGLNFVGDALRDFFDPRLRS